mmetsp:Transcript_42700/g.91587  ORF Transcript_42700/g.91587 Transcript_42700/m.91587 type:complete len:211 (-) Transcript_42700:218-850(-)
MISRGDNSWQAKERNGRVVWMDAHEDVATLCHWHHLSQEVPQVLLHILLGQSLVLVQCLLELLNRVHSVAHAARKPSDDVVSHSPSLLLRPRVVQSFRFSFLSFRVLCLGAWSLQDVQIEDCELLSVEAQGGASVGPDEVKVRPCPIHNRHEVVAENVDTAFPHIFDTLAIPLDVHVAVRATIFHLLVNGDAFDDGPSETSFLDHFLPLL